MKIKTCLLIALSVFLFQQMAAQEFGGFPAYFRWKQVNTDTATVIFTGEISGYAERIAGLIHRMAADTSFSLGPAQKKIDILLHNQSTTANGYVALGPFRSEFFMVPVSSIFDFGNLSWQENLAIHEYRHVQQYNNFNNGLTKVFSFLLGEQGQDLANAITIPNWFFEGDAVFAETVYSNQGRGRLPYFLSGYKSLWAEGKDYSWMKLRNGSLKHYVPNHYQLGYLLTNYGYEKYGNDFWQKVTRDASSFKGLFYPFQKAVKKYSGQNFTSFRKDALSHYKIQVNKEESFQENSTVTSYYHPQYISDDSIIYLKTAFDRLPAFYIRTNKGEKKISLRNISSEEWFSYRAGKVAYTAFSRHARWGLINYNDIVMLDLSTGKEKRLTKKKRYYTPDISPSSNSIIAVEMNDSLHTNLHLLDIHSGAAVELVKGNNEMFFIQPRFVNEEKIVMGVRNGRSEIALRLYDLNSKKWEDIVPFSNYTTGLPFVKDEKIFFVSGLSGNDEIYEYDMNSGKIFRLTQTQTGNYYPAVYNNKITWSHFTANGLALKQSALDEMKRVEVGPSSWRSKQEKTMFDPGFEKSLLSAQPVRFPVKRYSRGTGLFNFHSWRPDYADPEFMLRFFSDNILNTFSNELFYRFNQNETSHSVGWNAAYGGLYPVITTGIEYIANRSFDFGAQNLDLNQFEARAGIQIPLNFTKGNFYRNINFGSNYVFSRVMPTGFYKDSFFAYNTTYFHHFLNWSQYLPTAVQHIYPKFGWNTSIHHRHLASGEGYQSLANAIVYLPSFGNHSLVVNGMFQQTDTNNVVFSNRFAMSRGFEDYYLSRMWKVAANYHLPLIYPDWGFANIAYLLRVRANVFFDISRAYSNNKLFTRDFKSTGGEIFFDTKWWNSLPVSFGFRVSYLLDDGLYSGEGKGSTFFEFIVPVGLIPG